jgi:tRNA dimethylallyltransferase
VTVRKVDGTLLVVAGPTGTGKSALAAGVAARIGGEIVGCDALQIYRGFDVGTAKPSAAERCGVPHHLIDELPPDGHCSLAEFVARAEAAIVDIASRGRVPVVVGGTGMYLRGLLRGIMESPPANHALRRRLTGMTRRFGAPRLHRWLAGLDPPSSERLDPRDSQRIERALELALSGETWSERLRREGTWKGAQERYKTLKIGLDVADREALAQRVERRVDTFFEDGLVEEVQGLMDCGVPTSASGFKAIGYREILAALESGSGLDDARRQIKSNTRAYVKRQRTWFRKEPGLTWLDATKDTDTLIDEVLTLWKASQRVTE